MGDIFAATRRAFDLPPGIIYLDGNSLGALPNTVKTRVAQEISAQWGQKLIQGWNLSGWLDMPQTTGNKIARLIGAAPGTVLVCDSTSINVFKVLSSAIALAGRRKVILSDSGNFPTDLYMAQGLIELTGDQHFLKIVAPEAVEMNIDETIAVVMLTQVDYRTGRLHDMASITAKAHAAGALMIWDLAHSAGALPVDLAGCDADFAVGCGYKYLNGGPGAPAFVYVRPDHSQHISPALSGWLGHDAPFAFEQDYRPAQGIDRMRVGTPPILALAALDTALDVWEGVALSDVRQRSIELSERFIADLEKNCPQLVLASPRNPAMRGSQVSFAFKDGYSAMQSIIAMGVIGDFRAPNLMRFGFTPLYLSPADVVEAATRIAQAMREERWKWPQFRVRARVT